MQAQILTESHRSSNSGFKKDTTYHSIHNKIVRSGNIERGQGAAYL